MKFAHVVIECGTNEIRAIEVHTAPTLSEAIRDFKDMNGGAADFVDPDAENWLLKAAYEDSDSDIYLFRVGAWS